MNGKYDTTNKDLVEINPADLLEILGQRRPPERVRTIDADLSTVATAADKVIWVDDPEPWIVHWEFHSYWDDQLPLSVHARNALLRKRHGVSVASVIFLLRPRADSPNLTGVLHNRTPIGKPSEFNYEVIRLWTLARDVILKGPLSLLPYAPLCGVAENELPAVVSRMKERLAAEANPSLAGKLWAATYILMGLQFKEELIRQLLSGVLAMRESVTYQAILREGHEKGREDEAREMLIRFGRKRFGAPDSKTIEKLNGIKSASFFEELSDRLPDVGSWQELLTEK